MEIYMPPVVQPRGLMEYANEASNFRNSQQQNRLNDLKLQYAPQQMAMEQQTSETELAGAKDKQEQQKLMFAAGMAKAVKSQAQAKAQSLNIAPNTPEYEELVNSVAHQFGPRLSGVMGQPYDPNIRVDSNMIDTLSRYDPTATETKNHLQIVTGQDGRLYYADTTKGGAAQPVTYNNEQITSPQYNPVAQGDIARAKAIEDIVEVTGPNGEKFRIPAGVAAGYSSAGRGQAQPIQPAFNQVPQEFANQPVLSPEQAAQLPTTQATPEDLKNLQGTQFQYGISQSGQNLGLPPTVGGVIKSPTLQEAEAMKGRGENTAKQEAQSAEAAKALPALLDNSNYLVSLIDSLKTHKGLSGVVGMPSLSGVIPGGIRGTPEADFNTRLDQVKGKAFQEAFAALKGAGAITDIEGQKASAALARLNTAQTEEEFLNSLDEFKNIVIQGQTRAKEKAGLRNTKIESNAPTENGSNQFKIELINE